MDKNFLINNLKMVENKRLKVARMLDFYELNLHMIIMGEVKKELVNFGLYPDFMKVVKIQLSKK